MKPRLALQEINNANISAIEASYEQGLLTISIDKKMEAMPRTIEIK
jgi:HSP20 family molecular chaperone IbpA